MGIRTRPHHGENHAPERLTTGNFRQQHSPDASKLPKSCLRVATWSILLPGCNIWSKIPNQGAGLAELPWRHLSGPAGAVAVTRQRPQQRLRYVVKGKYVASVRACVCNYEFRSI